MAGAPVAKTVAAQKRALEMFRENPALSYAECTRRLGFKSNCIVYKWVAKNLYGFRDAYEAVMKESFDALEGPALECMEELIKEHRSFQAAKYVLDKKGYGAAQKIEATVDNNVIINIE